MVYRMVYKNLIKKSKLAQMAGVSRTAANKFLVNKMPDSMVGKFVDLDHPLVRKYLFKHTGDEKYNKEIEKTKPEKKTKRPPAQGQAKGPEAVARNKAIERDEYIELETLDDDIQKLAHRSLLELCEIFGSNASFLEWLKALKSIEEVAKLRIFNEKELGNLVALELVRRAFVAPIENCHIQLLTDGMQTMAVQIFAKMKSDCTEQDIEDYMRAYVGKYIKRAKADVKRALRDADRKCRESSIRRVDG